MDCKEIRVDPREMTQEEMETGRHNAQLAFQFNHTMPMTQESLDLQHQLFGGTVGQDSFVTAPVQGTCFEKIKIGHRVFINSNLLAMARGGIEIGDRAQIAANVQLITNNHDPYDRTVLLCKPIRIEAGAWIGAGATILPGVRIGKHAVVGASSVVTHDVGDYEVVVGSPARVIRTLDPAKFAD